MSIFDGRQPPLFDVRKRLGNIERNNDEAESVQESWVDLAPSRGSLCSSVDAMVIVDAESSLRESSSPASVRSPHVELESNLEQVKYHLAKDMLPPRKNTDWIWDWSSRPEACPPKVIRHRSGQVLSTLSTPPNSPVPESTSVYVYKRKSPLFRFEVLFGFVVSNIVTFFIGAAIGFYMCKRLARGEKEF